MGKMKGTAGREKPQDCIVTVDLERKSGIEIQLNSKMEKMFGDAIQKAIREALSEMNEIFQITLKSLDIAIKSFENNKNNNDINEEIEDKIDTLEKKFRNNNIARLNAKQCYANAGVMFFDLLSNLERIGDHANNISNIKEEYTHKIYI